ncbi:50S ribosomal protein L11 methyltransferase [Lawsonia intracellularis]|nr:50S ribosomal protein L11 methyltransferase [Lawsonia intracellularis]AGC50567.1 50S ribosomal protein L11 methyltransferase [Lawsonia intracellularis N343]KAA0204583.1 50S ribosomal protein L11 methyltransferase [Lawsonia intracellularis]MBZ3893018.1 50S ribosomal protein L11 methyltransferase [Lawsonia intracellularis]OMQ02371.1 50S ribosomal protein L11 methyltransferase [Lawsonia intracellularis]RBN32831.1 50S ribosomal protein L11 methyltransferase [Lawsonia intracellularis]
MSKLLCIEIIADDTQLDVIISILFQYIPYGWEEESLSTGETILRIHCDNSEVKHTVCNKLQSVFPNIKIHVKEVPIQDWSIAWRDFFTPVIADQFLILPPWLLDTTPKSDQQIIVIEPKCAFGTGHHATTVLCLESISHCAKKGYLQPGMRFFDLGTGTGILGIACSLLGLTGIGADIDPIAISNASENIALNKVESQMVITEAGVEAGLGESFNLIVANILAEPLKCLALDLIELLAPSGNLILSGLLDYQADDVEAAYSKLGKAQRVISGEWVALIWNRQG